MVIGDPGHEVGHDPVREGQTLAGADDLAEGPVEGLRGAAVGQDLGSAAAADRDGGGEGGGHRGRREDVEPGVPGGGVAVLAQDGEEGEALTWKEKRSCKKVFLTLQY